MKRDFDELADCNDSNDATLSKRVTKRTDALPWADYFMAVAILSSQRSKDPNTRVGACLVQRADGVGDKRIVGIGYNGFPTGCSDDELPWDRTAASKYDTKYMYVCHAEVNAILNKNCADLHNCELYVALFPCNECTKIIIQSGVKKVIYLSDKYKTTEETRASKRMLDMSKVEYCQFIPKTNTLTIDFTEFMDNDNNNNDNNNNNNTSSSSSSSS